MPIRQAHAICLVLVAVATLLGAGFGAAASVECQPIEDRQLCITGFSVPEHALLVGQEEEDAFAVTVTNPDQESVTGVVMLYTASPENETNTYQMAEVTLAPGEERTLSRSINASTAGAHGLRVSVMDPESQEQFDISEVKTVEVREEPAPRLGGPIDRTEIALGALVLSVMGIMGLGYRQFGQ